ncbi:MAG: hypothetical protein K5873_00920 [Treponema sp.]|nr:hypothetical protein [Treponema sp.]
MESSPIAHFHLPGLFEFYDFYEVFLPLYQNHREYFYPFCRIDSIYGCPQDCLWGGGRTSFGTEEPEKVLSLMNKYSISPRLTFSNSLLTEEHLSDKKANQLCKLFQKSIIKSGIIIHSDLLLNYIKEKYPGFYFISSTTKVLTKFEDFMKEVQREDFSYVVPDFRLNKSFSNLSKLNQKEKDKVEFLCNECCDFSCPQRKECYENVSRKNLGLETSDHICFSKEGAQGYKFSKAMKNPGFISIEDIKNIYLKKGFSNFKIEGRGLGSALILEFLLYYLVKAEYQLQVREEIYLDSMLDLF